MLFTTLYAGSLVEPRGGLEKSNTILEKERRVSQVSPTSTHKKNAARHLHVVGQLRPSKVLLDRPPVVFPVTCLHQREGLVAHAILGIVIVHHVTNTVVDTTVLLNDGPVTHQDYIQFGGMLGVNLVVSLWHCIQNANNNETEIRRGQRPRRSSTTYS